MILLNVGRAAAVRRIPRTSGLQASPCGATQRVRAKLGALALAVEQLTAQPLPHLDDEERVLFPALVVGKAGGLCHETRE